MDDFRQATGLDQLTGGDTIALARTAAEAIRGLNHATRHDAGLGQPAVAYDVLGALSLAASRLGQLSRQLREADTTPVGFVTDHTNTHSITGLVCNAPHLLRWVDLAHVKKPSAAVRELKENTKVHNIGDLKLHLLAEGNRGPG